MRRAFAAAASVALGLAAAPTARGGAMLERLAAAAGAAAPAVAPPCPSLDDLRPGWVEHATLPQSELERHLARPSTEAVPMLLPVAGLHHWIGVSVRNPEHGRASREPACFVVGSAAFYENGLEQEPRVDIVEAIRSGEPRLREHLVELRWFDPSDGLRHRWFDAEAARRLGWPATGSPLPLPFVLNSLF